MFQSELDNKADRDSSANLRRRAFLTSAAAFFGAVALWQWKRLRVLEASAATASKPGPVTVVLFSDSGERLKKVSIAKVIKTPDEWRKQLSPNAYDITRNA